LEEIGFEAAVAAQARALVGGDDAAFASWLTPAALLALRPDGRRLPRARKYDIVRASHDGGRGESEVRFRGAGSFVMRETWECRDGAWKAVAAELPSDGLRLPWWRRLLPSGTETTPQRRELS